LNAPANGRKDYSSVSEIKRKFEWPSVDLYDYSVIPDQIAGYEDYPIRGGGSEPFLIYKNLRGQRKIMLSYVAEDFGSQTDLLFSPEHIREFFLPRMKKMIDLAHSNGVYVFFHSDGSIRRIIPDMIEAGIDILNPIQWRCKDMDRESLKRDFGDKVIFHGAMDNQQTLAFGSEEDVRQEVRDNLRILGRGGGYILAPCHNIQPITPVGNILDV